MKHLLLATTLLLPAAAFAAPTGVTLSPDRAVTIFNGTPGMHNLPKWKAPPGKVTIFDTLGTGDAYNSSSGWTISNAASQTGIQQWFAFAITPTADVTVTEIVEAVSFVTGKNSATIALLADSNGVPGAVLESKTVKNLQVFGNCCAVAVDHLKKGVKIKAGTTFWVGAILPSKRQSTTWDAWNYSSENTGSGPAAFYNGTWNTGAQTYSAFAVYGK